MRVVLPPFLQRLHPVGCRLSTEPPRGDHACQPEALILFIVHNQDSGGLCRLHRHLLQCKGKGRRPALFCYILLPVPTIPLASGLGLEFDGSLAPGASLASLLPSFQQLAPLTLAAVPRSAFNAGLKFSHDMPLPGDLGLSIAANSTAQLTIIRDRGASPRRRRPLRNDHPRRRRNLPGLLFLRLHRAGR
jgi:hypothetical protein